MTDKELNYLGEKLKIGMLCCFIVVLQLHRATERL